MGYSFRQATLIVMKKGIFGLLIKVIGYPVNIVLAFYYSFTLKDITRNYSLEELVDFVFNRCHGLIRPFQVKSELLEFIKAVARARPEVVVEIGTACGGTLFLLSRAAADNAIIVSIDLSYGKFGGGYPVWRAPFYRSFAFKRQKLYLIRGDSHQESILHKLENILNGRKVDCLYIDGDHTYEGVKEDFEMYSALLNNRALIAFHDIAPNPPEPGAQVNKFWNEIKNNYQHNEIIENRGQSGAGIGVLLKQ